MKIMSQGQFYCWGGSLSTYHSFTVTSMIPSPMSDSLNWTMGPRLAEDRTHYISEDIKDKLAYVATRCV